MSNKKWSVPGEIETILQAFAERDLDQDQAKEMIVKRFLLFNSRINTFVDICRKMRKHQQIFFTKGKRAKGDLIEARAAERLVDNWLEGKIPEIEMKYSEEDVMLLIDQICTDARVVTGMDFSERFKEESFLKYKSTRNAKAN